METRTLLRERLRRSRDWAAAIDELEKELTNSGSKPEQSERLCELAALVEDIIPERDRAIALYQRAWKLHQDNLRALSRAREVYGEINRRARDGVPTDVAVRTVLRHGAPARAITELAAGHDLVVMGTHGRGRIGEALAGSVSRAVVHALRGPVLLMRAPADAAPEPTVAGEIGR